MCFFLSIANYIKNVFTSVWRTILFLTFCSGWFHEFHSQNLSRSPKLPHSPQCWCRVAGVLDAKLCTVPLMEHPLSVSNGPLSGFWVLCVQLTSIWSLPDAIGVHVRPQRPLLVSRSLLLGWGMWPPVTSRGCKSFLRTTEAHCQRRRQVKEAGHGAICCRMVVAAGRGNMFDNPWII